MKRTQLVEHQVIAHCVAYLINKGATIDHIAVRFEHKKEVQEIIKEDLRTKYNYKNIINELTFEKNKGDILATYYHNRKYANRRLIVEAKGGNVYYGIYTVIGQLICQRESDSPYWWFAVALPSTWKSKIFNLLTSNNKVKPIISIIIKNFTRNGQGLNFFFVDENGYVESVTWKTFLKRKPAPSNN